MGIAQTTPTFAPGISGPPTSDRALHESYFLSMFTANNQTWPQQRVRTHR